MSAASFAVDDQSAAAGRSRVTPSRVAVAVAGLWCAVHVALRPDSVDLSTGLYRAHLFERGAWLWNNHWFGGHPLPGSGVLPPALGAAVGAELVMVVSVLVAAGAFGRLVEQWVRVRPDLAHPRLSAALFATGCATNLWGGRVAFTVSVAFVVLCVLFLQSGRTGLAAVAGVATSLSSPVGVLALLVVLSALWCSCDLRRRSVAIVGVAVALPTAAVVTVFPEGGWYPFAFGRFAINVLVIVVVAWYGRDIRIVRWLALVYGLATLGAFFVRTPLGGNVSRVAWVGAAALAALVVRRHRLVVLPLYIGVALFWSWSFVGMAFVSNSSTANADYYLQLREQLRSMPDVTRLEVVPTSTYLHADVLALEVPIARGWLTQLDRELNSIFYDGRLTEENFHEWLLDHSVSHVALPLDDIHSKSVDEAALVGDGPGFLREVWSDDDWRLFEVVDAEPIVDPGGEVLDVGFESLTLRFEAAGDYEVRYRDSDLYRVTEGSACLAPGDAGWLSVRVERPGTVRLEVSLAAALTGGSRC